MLAVLILDVLTANQECPTGDFTVPILNSSKPVVGANDYYGCTKITTVTVPSPIKEIHSEAFAKCTAITKVTLPNTIVTIAYAAFNGCTSLAAINLEEGLTGFGASALRNTHLTSLVFPSTLKSISQLVVSQNPHLVSIEFRKPCASFTIVDKTTFLGNGGQTLWFVICGAKTITIPETVVTIVAHAFAYCTASQNSIVIPDNVTSIGHRVCYAVKTIETIELGSNSEFESTAFDGWLTLKSIVVSDDHKYYSSDASGILYSKGFKTLAGYPQARSDTCVTIPDETEAISGGVFGTSVSRENQ